MSTVSERARQQLGIPILVLGGVVAVALIAATVLAIFDRESMATHILTWIGGTVSTLFFRMQPTTGASAPRASALPRTERPTPRSNPAPAWHEPGSERPAMPPPAQPKPPITP